MTISIFLLCLLAYEIFPKKNFNYCEFWMITGVAIIAVGLFQIKDSIDDLYNILNRRKDE